MLHNNLENLIPARIFLSLTEVIQLLSLKLFNYVNASESFICDPIRDSPDWFGLQIFQPRAIREVWHKIGTCVCHLYDRCDGCFASK